MLHADSEESKQYRHLSLSDAKDGGVLCIVSSYARSVEIPFYLLEGMN